MLPALCNSRAGVYLLGASADLLSVNKHPKRVAGAGGVVATAMAKTNPGRYGLAA